MKMKLALQMMTITETLYVSDSINKILRIRIQPLLDILDDDFVFEINHQGRRKGYQYLSSIREMCENEYKII